MKLSFLLSMVLFSSILSAQDLNTTIINGNKQVYTSLYKDITRKDTNISTDEINLEKTLLKKLINFKDSKNIKTDRKIAQPTNQDEYIKVFDSYISSFLQLNKTKEGLNNTDDKLSTITEEIKDKNITSLTPQLFYALYSKEKSLYQNQLLSLTKNVNKYKDLLLNSFENIIFDLTKYSDKLSTIQKNLQSFESKKQQFLVQKERYKLLNKENRVKYINEQIKKLDLKKSKILQDELDFLFLKYSALLNHKDKEVFKEHKNLISFLQKNITSQEDIKKDLDALLTKMEKKRFGTVTTIKEKGLQEVETQVEKLWKLTKQPIFTINDTPITIIKLITALLIFIIGFFIGSFYKRQIKRLTLKNNAITNSTSIILSNLGYYLIFIITFFIVLKVMGIDLSSIALVAGALSVGIGFGLQNIISNFVSGIILMLEKSIKLGDYIQLDENIRGKVVDIKMRAITINTNSNIDIIVPNQDLIQNHVINWTMNDKIRRFEIPFGVAYGTNPKEVEEVVLSAVKNSGFKDIYITKERFTRVVMTGMGDSSVDFELFVWIRGKEILYPKRTVSRFLTLIYDTLNENNIEIPFPQQDIHIRSIEEKILTNFDIIGKK